MEHQHISCHDGVNGQMLIINAVAKCTKSAMIVVMTAG